MARHGCLEVTSPATDSVTPWLRDSVAPSERRLGAAIEDSGQTQSDEALFDSWDALHPAAPGTEGEACQVAGGGDDRMTLSEAVGMMPYDYSPARLRCMELTVELDAKESSAS